MESEIDEMLDKICESVTTYELFREGEVIDDSKEFDEYISNIVGTTYCRIRIVKCRGDFYVYKERIEVDKAGKKSSECIAFYKLK